MVRIIVKVDLSPKSSDKRLIIMVLTLRVRESSGAADGVKGELSMVRMNFSRERHFEKLDWLTETAASAGKPAVYFVGRIREWITFSIHYYLFHILQASSYFRSNEIQYNI